MNIIESMERLLIAQVSSQVNRGSSGNKGSLASNNEVLESVLSSLDFLKDIMIGVVIIVLFYLLGKLIANRIVRRLQEAKGESLLPDMISLINRFSVVGSTFVGVSMVLQFIFHVDFLQIVGFFGLGVSFAFKDLLENLIAGAVIIIQNRFRVGDLIKIGAGIKGKVVEIQTRATILKAVDGSEIIVPNSELMTSPIVTYTTHHTRRIEFIVKVDFDADVQKAKQIILELVQAKPHILKKPSSTVIVKDIGESYMILAVRFWVDPQNKEKSWVSTRSELVLEVKQALEKGGILIPYPLYSYLDKKRGAAQ